MAAESYLKRKVGPLKMYQWIGLGVIAGLGLLIYNSRKGEAPEGEVFGGTGTGAFGPINPETGVPYAFEGTAAGGGQESAVQNFGEIVDLFGTLKEIFEPEETNTEPADAPAADPLPTSSKKVKKTRQQRREDKHGAGHGKKHQKHPKHPATSTGGAGHQAQPHQTSSHPITRIGQGVAVAVSHTAIGPGHAIGNGRPKKVTHPGAHTSTVGGGGGGKKGGGAKKGKHK